MLFFIQCVGMLHRSDVVFPVTAPMMNWAVPLNPSEAIEENQLIHSRCQTWTFYNNQFSWISFGMGNLHRPGLDHNFSAVMRLLTTVTLDSSVKFSVKELVTRTRGLTDFALWYFLNVIFLEGLSHAFITLEWRPPFGEESSVPLSWVWGWCNMFEEQPSLIALADKSKLRSKKKKKPHNELAVPRQTLNVSSVICGHLAVTTVCLPAMFDSKWHTWG